MAPDAASGEGDGIAEAADSLGHSLARGAAARREAVSRLLLPQLAAIVPLQMPLQKAQNSRTVRSKGFQASGRRTKTRSLRLPPRLSAKVALGPHNDGFRGTDCRQRLQNCGRKLRVTQSVIFVIVSSLSPFWLSALA